MDIRDNININNLPLGIRNSLYLSQTHLQKMASIGQIPIPDPSFTDVTFKNIVQYYSIDPVEMEKEIHRYAAKLIDNNHIEAAWQVLLAVEEI